MAGEVQALREEVAAYDALRDSQVVVLEVDSLRELPDALIRARIATGLTQKALDARLEGRVRAGEEGRDRLGRDVEFGAELAPRPLVQPRA